MKLFAKLFSSIAVVVLAAATMFAQDGRTKINFYNQTSTTLRFTLNGDPACTGDVIPQGTCTEILTAGNSYTPGATNGRQSVSDSSFVAEYGNTYTYTVREESTNNTGNPDLIRTASLRTVSSTNYGSFTVDAPVTLTTSGPTHETTTSGKPYVKTVYGGSLPNGDYYAVGIGDYPFAVVRADLDKVTDGFVQGVNGTVVSSQEVTVSGQPAIATIVNAEKNGRKIQFAILVTFKDNLSYVFAFGTWSDAEGTNLEDVKTFFRSARLN